MNELFPLYIGLLFILFLILREFRKLSCPNCKKISGQEIIKTEYINSLKEMQVRRCTKCGHEYEIEKAIHQEGFGGGEGGGGE